MSLYRIISSKDSCYEYPSEYESIEKAVADIKEYAGMYANNVVVERFSDEFGLDAAGVRFLSENYTIVDIEAVLWRAEMAEGPKHDKKVEECRQNDDGNNGVFTIYEWLPDGSRKDWGMEISHATREIGVEVDYCHAMTSNGISLPSSSFQLSPS